MGFLLVILATLSVALAKTFSSKPSSRGAGVESSSAAVVHSNSRQTPSPRLDEVGSDADTPLLGHDEGPVDHEKGAHHTAAPAQQALGAPRPTVGNDSGTSDPPRRDWLDPGSELASWLGASGRGGATQPSTVTAGPTGSSPAPAGANGSPQVREVFFGTSEESACQPGPREFLLANVDDLYVCVVWSGLGGTHAEHLTFLTPEGHLYQDLSVAFVTAGATPPADGIEVRGRRLPVQAAGLGANGECFVVARLPVGGTFISRFNIGGLWTVEVSLDDSAPLTHDNFDLLTP